MRDDDPAESLAAFLAAPPTPRSLLVVTGAGVSVASGIPTFRGTDPGAIWKHDVTTLGTFAYFEEDPVGSWRWYISRFEKVVDAKPNAAHDALVALERRQVALGGDFLLVTQNVDTLHERAGSSALVKVHGSADRVRCPVRGCRFGAPSGSLPRSEVDLASFLADPREATLPRCPACGSVLRQHVLWFDETYGSHADYRFRRVLQAAESADRVLFVGTSFSVGATEAVLELARRSGADVLSIDPGAHSAPSRVRTLRAAAEVVLPDAVARWSRGEDSGSTASERSPTRGG
jgi:NAD-dependent deacetylase